jgi:hypothetical protein
MSRRVRLNIRRLSRIADRAPERIDRLAEAVAVGINSDIVMSFGTSPSSPGEPPGVDTGTLRASMHVEREAHAAYRVADGVLYGIYLEMGTEKMAARPFVVPVFEDWRARNYQRVAEVVRSSNLFR